MRFRDPRSLYLFLILFSLTNLASADFNPNVSRRVKAANKHVHENTPSHLGNVNHSQEKKRWIVIGNTTPLAAHVSQRGLSSVQAQESVNSEVRDLSQRVRKLSGAGSVKGSTKNASVALFIEATPLEVNTLKREGLNVIEDKTVKINLEQAVTRTNVPSVWALSDQNGIPLKGRGVRIGIIDTGIDYRHTAFGACQSLAACPRFGGGYDYISNDNDPDDRHGHGTHVAGIAAGAGSNYSGVAPEATLFAVKVLSDQGYGSYSNILAGLDYVLDPNGDNDLSDHLDVINLSLGGDGGADSVLSVAVDNVVSAGVVAVVAAGNSGFYGGYSINSPGSSKRAITVGATYKQSYIGQELWGDTTPTVDEVTPFSSRGPTFEFGDEYALGVKPDVVAPGAIICAPKSTQTTSPETCAPGRIGFSGTSMAAPHVAGIAAIMLQANRSLRPDEIKNILRRTARRLSPELGGGILDQGYGLVNAALAVANVTNNSEARIDTKSKISGGGYPIIGTATAARFLRYDLSYKSSSGTEWIIAGQGSTPISNGTLASLLLPQSMEENYIWLRLRVFSADLADIELVTEDYGLVYLDSSRIDYPRNYDRLDTQSWFPFSGKSTIEIRGSADSGDFQHYELSVCPKDGPVDKCKVLKANSEERIQNGILGTWKPSDTVDNATGYWKIRLKVVGDSGSRTDENEIYVDSDLVPGFPLNTGLPCIASLVGEWTTYSCWTRNQPTAVDLNGDGVDELGFANGPLISILNSDGIPLPGWPKEVPACNRPRPIPDYSRGVTFADVNRDGQKDVIAGDICGRIHIFSIDGTPLAGTPIEIENHHVSSIAAADIDEDGLIELVFTTNGLRLHAMKPDGTELQGFPKELPAISPQAATNTEQIPAPLVLDIHPRAGKEIVISTRTCEGGGNCLGGLTTHQGAIWAVGSDGAELAGFPHRYNGRVFSPTAFDVDKDGQKEILFMEKSLADAAYKIHVQKINGNEITNFPLTIPIFIQTDVDDSISAADLDGDGSIELVFVGDNCVFVYGIDGRAKPGFPYCAAPEDLSELELYDIPLTVGEPLLVNLDDDYRTVEIGVPVVRWSRPVHGMNDILILRHNGEMVPGAPKMIDTAPASTSLAVTRDGSGYLKLFSISQRMNLYKWDTKSCACESDSWEQSRGGPSKTGEGKSERMCDACTDDCPSDPLKLKPGRCGCGVSDIDSDGDLTPDCLDQCPNDGNKLLPGICGCGVVDSDPDGDGVCGVIAPTPIPSISPTPKGSDDPVVDPLTTVQPPAPNIKIKKKKVRIFLTPYIDSKRSIMSEIKVTLNLRGKGKRRYKTIQKMVSAETRFIEIKRPKKKGRVQVSYRYRIDQIVSKESLQAMRKFKAS